MTLLIDPPNAAGHGRLWSHLASDASYDELHAFARTLGIPARGFDRDHYDVPASHYDRVVAAGAAPISSRELVERLVTVGLRRRKGEVLGPRPAGIPLVRPFRLKPGDTVAVVATSGRVAPERLVAGIDVLREWGLEVRGPAEPDPALPWLAGSDEQRAAELTAAWTDPDVRAVIATRGGFGSQRLLDRLDWAALEAAGPKIFVGFSDLTALHQAAASRLGLATVHGPHAASLSDRDDTTRDGLRTLLFDGKAPDVDGLGTIVPGQADGTLLGGNMAMLASSLGTRFVHPADGAIVVLEDIGEAPYRLDRALTHLLRAGWFDGVQGIVLGEFTKCGDPEQVDALFRARLAPLGVPVVSGAAIGHGDTNLAITLGTRARLDADAGRLEFLESALR